MRLMSFVEKLSFWIQDCLQNHHNCSPLIPSGDNFLSTRLLDVGDPEFKLESIRLILTSGLPVETDVKYIALSHCWEMVYRTFQPLP
jgi:hypothetical protein